MDGVNANKVAKLILFRRHALSLSSLTLTLIVTLTRTLTLTLTPQSKLEQSV